MSDAEHPTCPVCGGTCTRGPLHRFTLAQAAAHMCPQARDAGRYERLVTCIRKLWDGDHCTVHVCEHCSFGFGWPHVGGDGEYYAILHEMAGYPTHRWEFDETTRRVLSQTESGCVLDIGAGTGSFLDRAPIGWRRFGVETSPHLRAILSNKGHTALDSPDQAKARGESFDVVTLFQVLEHVAEFRSLLNEVHGLLREGGRVAISVPEGGMVGELERITGMSDMPPNHINRWTRDSMRRALEQCGFIVESQTVEPNRFSHAKYYAILKVRGRAQDFPRSWCARSYGIRHRPLRLAVQAGLSGLAFVSMIHHLPTLCRGQSLLTIARRA